MKHITFHFDFISPFAWLAFDQLPRTLEGLSYSVTHKPLLFGAVLQHFGQLGPAEIAPKRVWTYRQVNWLAKQQGTPLDLPASHPFNPLPLLRLALACGQGGACNRYITEMIFRHVWQGAGDATDPARMQALVDTLKPARAIDNAAVKAELKANTDAAIARGIFGVPSFEVDGQIFWGLDSLLMLRAYLEGSDWFGSAAWTQAGQQPVGVTRR
jgi:2-hydroxychromene-2-carboxylate isomerase